MKKAITLLLTCFRMFFLILFKSPKSISNHYCYSYNYNYDAFHYDSPPPLILNAILQSITTIENTIDAPMIAFCSISYSDDRADYKSD